MIDDTKTIVCFTNNYYSESIYLKLSPESLNFLNFLQEKDLLNSDWGFENVKEMKIYEF